jgi:predicted Zn-dependent protease
MRSFRPLTEAEKESVKAIRLRVVEVKEGESLQELGKRTKNEWTVHETAVRNGIFADVVMRQGEKLKIAIAESYMPVQEETGASLAE